MVSAEGRREYEQYLVLEVIQHPENIEAGKFQEGAEHDQDKRILTR